MKRSALPDSARELADARVRSAVQAVENDLVELKLAMAARDKVLPPETGHHDTGHHDTETS